MAVLCTGAGATVTAQMDADLFAGIVGSEKVVLAVGRQMEGAIIDNNTVRIYDGSLVCQGRHVCIEANTSEDFYIDTGEQGVTRYDIIGFRLYREDGNELCEQFVQKNVGESEDIVENTFRNGAEEVYVSMYKVKIESLTITELMPLFGKKGIAEEDQEKADSGWITASVASSFTAVSGYEPRYRKIGNIVEIRGEVNPTTDIKGSVTEYPIFTLPEGFRPDKKIVAMSQGRYDYFWMTAINENGIVTFSRYRRTQGSEQYSDAGTQAWLPFAVTFMV